MVPVFLNFIKACILKFREGDRIIFVHKNTETLKKQKNFLFKASQKYKLKIELK